MTDIPKNEKLFLDDLAVGAEFNSEKYAVEAHEEEVVRPSIGKPEVNQTSFT
jgi:hypothetical protein